MVSGMQQSQEKLIDFSRRSPIHKNLASVIRRMSAQTSRFSQEIHNCFVTYSKDCLHLTESDLRGVFESLREAHERPLETSAIRGFVKAMDTDGNGSIEKSEWTEYLMFGMTMTLKWRKSFANRSVMHEYLIRLIEHLRARAGRDVVTGM